MKRIVSILILGILVIGSLGALATAEHRKSDLMTIKESISISRPIIEEENEFVTVSLKEGNSYLLDPGSPMLPVVSKVFTLPFGSKVNKVEVSYSDEKEITLSKNVKLASEPMPIGTITEITKEDKIYSSSQILPQEKFNYRTGTGIFNDDRVIFLTVQCYPISYNSAENILYYHDNIEISISYSEGETSTSEMDEYDLLIISSTVISPTIQNLIDHKTEHGVQTMFKLVDEIYDEYPGRDEPEKIKYFIKDAIETYDISYVLLLGNIYDLPIRHTALEVWHDLLDLPTDIYYADIYDSEGEFCSWDANDNDIFGEYDRDHGNIDQVDLYVDVMVGRIPFQNSIDLNIVINKIITYENSAYGSNWFKKILLMGGDTFPDHGNIEGEFVTGLVGEEMENHGFETITLWTSENTFKPFNINLKTSLGAGFISYSGHGYEHGFGTSPPDVEERISYYNPYLLGMLNGNKLPIVFFDACLSATLDRTILNIFKVPGFAYNMVKKFNGGAIAAIGATRVAFTDVGFSGVYGGAGYLNLHFFKNYEDGNTLGEMLTKSQNDYLNYVGEDCITLEEFIIIGDPSLKVGGYP